MKVILLSGLFLFIPVSMGIAAPAHCLLKVKGHTYINRICNKSVFTSGGGFSLGTDELRSKYFVYVNQNIDGTAYGHWNADPESTHAHTSLGLLRRAGSCWQNKTAKICSWRIQGRAVPSDSSRQ